MLDVLDSETQENVQALPDSLYESWGRDGVWSPCSGCFVEKTVVESGRDARVAFLKYTRYFFDVLRDWTPDSNCVVLLPCGVKKPIGASAGHQKKLQAIRDGGLEKADVVVVSEPCTVVPPEYRLSLPAANYEFPPEYTARDSYPNVFNVFVERLALWLDEMGYDYVFAYLIRGHMNKFDAAVELMESSPEIVRIPSASFNPDSESFSGDRFKSLNDMMWKVRAVVQYKSSLNLDSTGEGLPDAYDAFYSSRFG